VERWYRHTSDCWWLILISSGWFPPPSHSHRRAGSWLRYLLLVFPERPVPRDCHGPEPGGAEAVLLDSTDGERRNGGRLCFGLACERGGIPPGPVLTNILRQPMKKAFACSLAVSCILGCRGRSFMLFWAIFRGRSLRWLQPARFRSHIWEHDSQ